MRLVSAVFLAFLLGLDRELKHKPFGFRPYMMVSLGAAAFTLILMEYIHQHTSGATIIDPSRVMQGLITGIGFLGAGAMLRARQHIVGATTGAGIWVVGGIGMACGFGFYWHAFLFTLMALFIMAILQPLHAWLQRRTTLGQGENEN